MSEDNRVNETENEIEVHEVQSTPVSEEKKKRFKHTIELTWGKLAAIFAVCLVLSVSCGIGSAYLFTNANDSSVIYQNSAQAVSTSAENSDTIKAVVEECANSVVEIQTESVTNGSNPFQQYVSSGAGSGVILTKDGYIVTNNHVVDGASTITVRTRNGDEYQAKLIGTDEQSDLAVIKIDADNLTPTVLGDSTKLEVGDLAVVIGNPLGELGGTVTSGIISALDREMTIDGQTMTLLQTNAAVNPGNSGGGLFNSNGDLVGIINAKSSGEDVEGIGFAIPISSAKEIIDELIENGEVTSRPTLGVTLYNVEDSNAAAQLGVDSAGVYVIQVVSGGVADKAGIKSGDRIIAFDETTVNTAQDIKSQLSKYKIGDTVTITVDRDGKQTDLQATL